jgi:hypothetical protein
MLLTKTVSLQINLSPNDYPHAKYLLPYQISVLRGQIDEIVLVLDTHRSKGRFGVNWEENLNNIHELLNKQLATDKRIRIEVVNYDAPEMEKVAAFFFGQKFVPKKDYRGGPFYAYLFGLYSCQSEYILHLDSDIFLGGASQTWVKEAIELFENNDKVFTCSPLPGPPHPGKILIGQPGSIKVGDGYQFKFSGMSTRVFMIKKDSFNDRKLVLTTPAFKNLLKSIIRRNPPYSLPELILSNYMAKGSLERIDFLGNDRGMWTLHPPYRTKSFYNSIPQLIEDIGKNNLPASQNGFYDIVDEVCDWTEAKEKLKNSRWWKKIIYGKNN